MKKEELVEKLSKKTKTSKNEARESLNTVLDEISDSLKKGKDVTLTGFGTFSVAKRKARQGINPKTQEKIKIAASKVPKFKPGKALRDLIKK